ncbi:hypothetical protein [Devosia aurantiaca]|uniref:DUF4435 domain-containing protein n=1 Tax=Devosia aurantiaca TaxID=2714858 RepID=A0A6M1SI44_9HYPH|nr:hypothetical protein [Devosia aurantiaca]NGP16524.1 hypothetical protein [Devosia aurantiaca]
MPSLGQIGDTTALKHAYIRKVVVYVESQSDVKLFRTIVGTGFQQYIDFEVPPDGGTGCGPVRAAVEKYRPKNPQVFALLDGEASVDQEDGFARFVGTDAAIFSLPQSEGVLYLADHEAENILFRQSDIVAYIADQTRLEELGMRDPVEILDTISAIVDRQFEGALCKYASYLLKAKKKMDGVLSATHKNKLADDELLELLIKRVEKQNCDWETFKAELDQVRSHIVLHIESLGEDGELTTVWRLADGKLAFDTMRDAYSIPPTCEAPLARKIADTEYAERFRLDLFRLTDIDIAA